MPPGKGLASALSRIQKINDGLDEEVGLVHEGHVATHPEFRSVSTTHTSAAKTKAFPGLMA